MRTTSDRPFQGGMQETNGTGSGLEPGLEQQRPFPVGPVARSAAVRRSDSPEAVILIAEQPGEARIRIESRQAEPVDRAVHAHQPGGPRVSDQCVILYATGHGSFIPVLRPVIGRGNMRSAVVGFPIAGVIV
jgi:hypothetical protein